MADNVVTLFLLAAIISGSWAVICTVQFLVKRPPKLRMCACGHGNNYHQGGEGKCTHFDGLRCNCNVFVPDPKAPQKEKEVRALERMMNVEGRKR